MMTNRQRLLSVLGGSPPDRVPWIPRLEIWYVAHRLAGTLPPEFEGMRLREIERALGVGTPARTGRVFTTRIRDVDTVQRRDGLLNTVEHITPYGTVSYTQKRTPDLDRLGIQPLVVEKMLKRPEDYDAVTYLFENTEFYPCYEEYEAYDREIGDDGLPMVSIGDVPFHHFLADLAGYERAYLDLFDFPDRVERLLRTIEAVYRERMWPLVAKSPAKLVLHGAHFSSQTTPPDYYDRFITPYTRDFTEYMHRHGKTVAQHADNDTKEILGQLADSGYDMQECFVTAPMVPCTLKEARQRWGARMIIWGGLPSVMLEPSVSDERFNAYMRDLFRTIAPGDAFILGVADNVMPTSMISRIRQVTEMVQEMGAYPVAA
jgi:uroporphyrinogen-III decarboxylase